MSTLTIELPPGKMAVFQEWLAKKITNEYDGGQFREDVLPQLDAERPELNRDGTEWRCDMCGRNSLATHGAC